MYSDQSMFVKTIQNTCYNRWNTLPKRNTQKKPLHKIQNRMCLFWVRDIKHKIGTDHVSYSIDKTVTLNDYLSFTHHKKLVRLLLQNRNIGFILIDF